MFIYPSRPGQPCSASLHELTPLECDHISRRQIEPLAVLTLGGKSPVPVGFNAGWIIGPNHGNRNNSLRKLKHEFSLAPSGSICPAQLVELARFNEVNEAEIFNRLRMRDVIRSTDPWFVRLTE